MSRPLQVFNFRARHLLLPFAILFLAGVVLQSQGPSIQNIPGSCVLTIEVTGLRNGHGAVLFKIVSNGKFVQKGSAVIDEKTMTASTVVTLPKDDYSISVFHDENGNGVLDHNIVGMPTEGYGFSNNPPKMPGAPKIADTVFRAGQDKQLIEINLIYWP